MAPVLMLTASDTEADTVAGLQAGADDYLTKPFGAPEFLARVRALLRRVSRSNAHAAQSTLTTGELTIELSQHRVLRAGMPINLTPTEYRLLEYLARHAGRVVSQQELLGSVWGPAYVDEHHLLRVNIARLRRKVEVDTATPEYIITRAGVGYSLARHEASGLSVAVFATHAELVYETALSVLFVGSWSRSPDGGEHSKAVDGGGVHW